MLNRKIFIVCAFLLAAIQGNSFSIKGVDYSFEQILSDELLNQTVTCIYKDHFGYVWIGTNYGLFKYDGNSFKIYRTQLYDSTSICSNKIYAIYEDTEKVLCVLSEDTFTYSRYNSTYDNFIRYSYDNNSSTYPYPIPANKKKAKFLCAGDVIYQYIPRTGKYERIVLNTNYNVPSITSYVEDAEGKLWIGSFTIGLLKYDPIRKTLISFPTQSNSYLSDGRILDLFYDSQGYIWIGGLRDAINCFDPKKEKYVKTWSSKNNNQNINISVGNFCEDNLGKIWMSTSQGINIYDKEQDKFVVVKTNPLQEGSLLSNNVKILYRDDTNKIWIGTDGAIQVYDPYRVKFKNLLQTYSDNEKLNKSFKSAFKDSKGNLWIGTDLGLNKFDKNGNLKKTFISNSSNIKSIDAGGVCAIHENTLGDLWVGTWGGGLNRFDQLKENFTRFGFLDERDDPKSIGDINILCLQEDKKGNLWIGTVMGILDVFNPETGKFHHIDLKAEYIRALLIDEENRAVWCCTSDGFFKIDLDTYQFKQYLANDLTSNSISDNYTTDLVKDRKGNIWITTLNGLNRFNIQTNSFEHFSNVNNIPLVGLSGIQIDRNDNLWFSNHAFLLRFDPVSHRLFYYNKGDGIVENMQYSNELRSGELAFGGVNGVNIFFPDDIKIDSVLPKVIITDFKVFNKSVNWSDNTFLNKAIEATDEINLSYKQSVFGFDFSALSVNSNREIQYAYILEGLDSSWNYIGDRGNVSFSNLSAGDYVFRVKSSNREGLWGNNETAVAIHISPPFWQTSWFIFLMILVGLLILFFANLIQTYSLKKRNELLAVIVKVRTKHLKQANVELEEQKKEMERMAKVVHESDQKRIRFLVGLSHEFRTPLTLIINPIQKVLPQISANQELESLFQVVSKNAQVLLNLINQVLDLNKLETDNMRLLVSKHNVYSFLHDIYRSFTNLADNEKIKFSFHPNFSDRDAWFDAPKIERVVINLLSNAFKFTPQHGNIALHANISDDGNIISIEVRDSGIGIPPAELENVFHLYYQIDNSMANKVYGSGIGLNLAKELIELHHGSIYVDSVLGEGSCFGIEFPIDVNCYTALETLQPHEPITEYENKNLLLKNNIPINQPEASKDAPVVLIVEDNIDLRNFIKQNLSANYQIIEAENGLVGFEKVCEQMPDLVISDIMMPLMNGFELCEKIKADENVCHIPVILLTSQLGVENQVLGLRIKADDYITKPFHIEVLTVRIASILENRMMMRKRFSKDFKIGPNEIPITSLDKIFIEKAIQIVETNMGDAAFDVDAFSKEMGLSTRQIFNKMKALTDVSPGDFIRTIRLKRAAQLITDSGLTVSQIAFEVGFANVYYFSTAFKKYFGLPPTEYKTKK